MDGRSFPLHLYCKLAFCSSSCSVAPIKPVPAVDLKERSQTVNFDLSNCACKKRLFKVCCFSVSIT